MPFTLAELPGGTCRYLQFIALQDGADVLEDLDGDLLMGCGIELAISASPPIVADSATVTVGDDGGGRLELASAWVEGEPHTVEIAGVACYSGRAGEGYTPIPRDGLVRAIVPPDLPVGGPYDIVVSWGGDAAGSLTLADSVTVVRRIRRQQTYILAQNFPPAPYDRPRTQLQDGPILESGVTDLAAGHVFGAYISAIGEMLNDTGGAIFTRLTADLEPALLGTTVPAEATTAQVESTHTFPDAGEVITTRGERIAYTGKTATTLTGLSRDDSIADAYQRGESIALVSNDHSAIDRARSALVLARAEGPFLNVIGANHGVPRYLDANDTLYRRMIQVLAYQAGKGSPYAIEEFLDLVLDDRALTGEDATTAGASVTVASAPFTDGMMGFRLRLNDDPGQTYRIRTVTSSTVVVPDLVGSTAWAPYIDPGFTDVAWRLLPYEVMYDPWQPGTVVIKIGCPTPSDPTGFAYLNPGEVTSSDNATQVTAAADIRQVLGVWLASDVAREGTNYATNNNFAGRVITLNSALPSAVEPVIVDYGSIEAPSSVTSGDPGSAEGAGTSQILKDVTWRNPVGQVEIDAEGYAGIEPGGVRYPLYLGDRLGAISGMLNTVVMAGIKVVIEIHFW